MGVSMVWCTHFVSKLKVHIVLEVVTCKISLTLNSLRNHIQLIWDLKIKPIISTMNVKLIHNCIFM